MPLDITFPGLRIRIKLVSSNESSATFHVTVIDEDDSVYRDCGLTTLDIGGTYSYGYIQRPSHVTVDEDGAIMNAIFLDE